MRQTFLQSESSFGNLTRRHQLKTGKNFVPPGTSAVCAKVWSIAFIPDMMARNQCSTTIACRESDTGDDEKPLRPGRGSRRDLEPRADDAVYPGGARQSESPVPRQVGDAAGGGNE